MDVEGDVIETVVEVATRESPVPDNRAWTLELFAAFVEKVKSWLGEPTTFGENDPVSRHSAPGITDPFAEQLFTAEFPIAKIVDGEVDNDQTLTWLADSALSHARAGADIVAPSDMMDGRVAAIRTSLDQNGFEKTAILAYAAKFASAFYGPFREAAGSAPQFGDRRTYQMDPANAREAVHEMTLDFEEGADMLMVKPALPYLDLIRQARELFPVPIAAYQVSGEFSMLMAAVERGWLEYERAMMESLTSIRRAGADIILTYFARDAARVLA